MLIDVNTIILIFVLLISIANTVLLVILANTVYKMYEVMLLILRIARGVKIQIRDGELAEIDTKNPEWIEKFNDENN